MSTSTLACSCAAPWLMAGILLGFLALKASGDVHPGQGGQACLIKSGPSSPCCWRREELAFVVFQAAAGAPGVFGRDGLAAHRRGGASMLISPLLLVLVDRALLRRYAQLKPPRRPRKRSRSRRKPRSSSPAWPLRADRGAGDADPGHPHHRAGPTAWRSSKSPAPLATACFMATPPGWTCCASPGPSAARVLVVAVDAAGASLKIVTLARKHFPQLQVVARARDLTHWNALRDLGVDAGAARAVRSPALPAPAPCWN